MVQCQGSMPNSCCPQNQSAAFYYETAKVIEQGIPCQFGKHSPCACMFNSFDCCMHFYLACKKSNSSSDYLHIRVSKINERYILGQYSKPFDTVAQCIAHYCTESLRIKRGVYAAMIMPVCKTRALTVH